ncbi:MAG: polysaccharide deacetylase family protein [Fimbriimonadaceae bacterium]|nr:polysaccharide deacetylase family protein [Fimbriimonadaceae bacterium]
MIFAALLAASNLSPAVFNQAQLDANEPTWQLARQRVDARLDDPWMERLVAGKVEIQFLKHGPPDHKRLALTFDDGPHGKVTYDLLKLLKEYDVRATFFVVGKMVINRKNMLRQMEAEGHEIANHSFSHPDLANLDLLDTLTEYKATQIAVYDILGHQPRFCRPPGGRMDEKTLRAASALGLTTVYWNSNPGDYKFDDPEKILERLRLNRQNGSIILLHSGLPQTVEALKTFIPECLKQGYEFVLLDGWRGKEQAANPVQRPAIHFKQRNQLKSSI